MIRGSVQTYGSHITPFQLTSAEARDWKFRLASHLLGDNPRRPDESAPLHPTVLERFAVADGVVQFDVARPYRPWCLRNNVSVRHFFDADDLIQEFKDDADKEAARRAGESASTESAEAERWSKAKREIERRKAN